MVRGNLRLVLSVVQRFAGRGENMDDLFPGRVYSPTQGHRDNFDPAQNVRFSTYGVPMIVGEVKATCGTTTPCGHRSIRDLGLPFDAGAGGAAKQNGREPKLSEIAARVGQSPENVAMALESAVTPTSLYEPVYPTARTALPLLDQLRDATGEESWISDMMFHDTVRHLHRGSAASLPCAIWNGKTQTQVGKVRSASAVPRSAAPEKGRAQPYQAEQICNN